MPLHPQAGDILSQRAMAELLAERDRGAELRPSEVSAYWRGRAVDELLASPGEWLGLELRKLLRILHPGDPTDMYSLPLERKRYLGLLWLLAVPPWARWILAVYGGRSLVDLRGRVWPLAMLVALHALLLLVFFVSTMNKDMAADSSGQFYDTVSVCNCLGWIYDEDVNFCMG